MRVLVIEDNIELAASLKSGLERSNFNADVANFGEDGEIMASTNDYNVILLDLNLPDKDGIEVLQYLREHNIDVPVIILSARDGLQDRTKGLNIGADDYITKPFEFDELFARIRAVVRRSYGRSTSEVEIGKLYLNPMSRIARYDGVDIELKPKEFDILEVIMMNHPNVVSTEAIAEHVYDETYDPFSSVMRVHMARVRKKLKDVADKELLVTIRGKGYQLCEERD